MSIGLVVLALVLLGGKQDNTNTERAQSSPSQNVTPAVSRIIREPSLLYVARDQHVSFLVALEYGIDSEIQHAAALVPPDASEEATTLEEATTTIEEATATASPAPPPPTATTAPTRVPPTPAPTKPPATQPAAPASSGAVIQGQATAYGPAFNGQKMGCGGVYSSSDPTILAVSPARYAQWPCGTQIQVCGPAGCIVVTRQDACPGCYANLVDLSEAGNAAVCGSPPHTCRVTLQVVQ